MPLSRQDSNRSFQSSREPQSRLENVRLSVHQLFSGRSRVGSVRREPPESPKTPQLPVTLGLGRLPSTHLHIPYLSRTNTSSSHRSNPSLSSPRSLRHPYATIDEQPTAPTSFRQEAPQPPVPAARAGSRRQSSPRRFVGVDPAEQHLAELAETGRRRRRRRSTTRAERVCLPKIKNRKIRSKLLSCFISGMFLTLVLTIYLALALSNRNESQEFHVLLILIILITTIFFCHALIRLCMMIIKPPDDIDPQQNLPAMIGPGGYANPTTPIRVALARDEEAAGIESEATKMPPPAYGLWRESVRVDPNRIFWQRNAEAALERQNSASGRPATANRPPSYLSDDGVDYVVEAAPRSIAPTTDVPLPPHPSERGRAWPR